MKPIKFTIMPDHLTLHTKGLNDEQKEEVKSLCKHLNIHQDNVIFSFIGRLCEDCYHRICRMVKLLIFCVLALNLQPVRERILVLLCILKLIVTAPAVTT